jgi:glutamate-1-semialdehyde 2,1-aminomutase
VMERLAPLGPVYQAGTMAGNPVALAAGIATLTQLRQPEVYVQLEKLGVAVEAKCARLAPQLRIARVGSLVWPYFGEVLPVTAEAIAPSAIDRYHQRYHQWLAGGVYLPPSGYEVSFLSTAHSLSDVEAFVDALAGG